MPKHAVLYLRVSTDDQTTDNQKLELLEISKQKRWGVVDVYEDVAVSGAKTRYERPEFKRLIEDALNNKFDVVMAWSVDRLGRSLSDLVGFLADLHDLNIGLYLKQQGIDTTTPAGKAMFQMCGVFAEFERAMIQERVKSGLERARAQGKKLGRPPLPDTVKHQILCARARKQTMRSIADELGVGLATVHRVVATAMAGHPPCPPEAGRLDASHRTKS